MSGFDWIEHPTGESASLREWRGETGSLWITRGVGGVLFRKRQTAWWFPIWPSWRLGWKEGVLNRNRLSRIDIHRAWLERISLQVWKWLFQGHHAKWLELHGLMDRLAEAHCIVLWRFLFRFFPLRVCCCFESCPSLSYWYQDIPSISVIPYLVFTQSRHHSTFTGSPLFILLSLLDVGAFASLIHFASCFTYHS